MMVNVARDNASRRRGEEKKAKIGALGVKQKNKCVIKIGMDNSQQDCE
jgi:hypothetical protein